MELKHGFPVIFFLCLPFFHQGCAHVGSTVGSDYAHVLGGTANIMVSPTLTAAVPVNIAIGDKVAEAAANAAVGYLKGFPEAAITLINRAEAVQKGVEAGVAKAAETGKTVDRKELEKFVEQVVARI